MGELADYMLNGDDCAGCGMPFQTVGDGFPRYCCRSCEPEGFRSAPKIRSPHARFPPKGSVKTIPCGYPGCEQLFHNDHGLMQHQAAKGH